jgi:uncharacterized protein (DUF433 family)
MRTTIEPTNIPLRADPDGTIRVGGTRVTLDVIIDAFRGGETPEQIAEGLESVTLADVYAAITYYLFHREQVEQYMQSREQIARAIGSNIARLQDSSNLRDRLMARRQGGS